VIPHARDVGDARLAWRARMLIFGLVAALVWICAPYLGGLLGAVVLYVACAPAFRRLRGRIGERTAAFALTVSAAALIVAPAVWLVATAVQEAPDALKSVASSPALARLREAHVGQFDLGAQLARVGDGAIGWASARTLSLFGSVTRATLNLLLALVGLYYLLPGAGGAWLRVRPLIPFSRAGAESLRERFVSVTEATLLSILATALTQGLVVGLSFALVGLPNALVWGVVTGLLSILPILGSSLVWGPGVIVLVTEGRYSAALVLFLIGFIIASNIDNVVHPLVTRRVSGLHPMATLVGAFSGAELMGLPGLLLGPLALAYAIELVRLYQQEYSEVEVVERMRKS
jgi:predicted PurR-regulated permease PerM